LSEIKITLDAFSQSSSLDESIKKLEKIIELSDKIKNNKDALKSGSTSANDTAKLVAENAKLAEAIEKVRIAEKKKQDTIKAEEGIVGSLKKEVRELNKAIDQSKNIKEVEQLNKKLTETKGKLNDVKNAGKEATNTFGNALSSFQFKFNVLGQAIGQLAVSGLTSLASQAVDFGKESVKAFIEAELNAKKLEVALQNIGGEGKGAFDKLIKQSEELQKISIFSDDDIQNAQTALVQYGLTSDEVEKLLPKILDLASAQGIDLATATDVSIKAINGQTKGLKTAGIAFEDTGTKAGNLAKLTDNLNKFQGQSSAIVETNAGKLEMLKNAYDDVMENVGEFIVDAAEPLVDILAFVANGFTIAGEEAEKFKDNVKLSEEEIKKLNSSMLAFQIATQKTLIEKLEKAGGDGGSIQKATEQLKKLNAQLFGGEASKMTDAAIEEQIKRLSEKKLEFLSKGELSNAEKIEILKSNLDAKSKLNEKTNDAKSGNEQKVKYREKIKLIKKSAEEEKTIIVENNEERIKSNDLEIAKFARLQKEKKEKIDKAHELGLEKLREEAEAEKEQQEERKKQALQFGEDVVKELEKISDKKIALLDKEISSQDKNIDKQRELADKGLANTLAFEERKKAELERAKIAEQKKQEKLAKIQAFFNAFASYSKDEPQTAAVKALKDVLLAEVVAKAFAKEGGIVGEIAEPLSGGRIDRGIFKGRSHARGGIHLEAEGNEGIFSGKEMGNLGRENFYNLKNLLKNPIDDGIFERQNDSFMGAIPIIQAINNNNEVVRELQELKATIKSKPETSVNWDAMNNMVIAKIENGFKTITTKKQSKRRF
jgi:hypothetical protein